MPGAGSEGLGSQALERGLQSPQLQEGRPRGMGEGQGGVIVAAGLL